MQETVTIDKGIPIPEVTKGRTSVYPFKEMIVGDSILCTCKNNPISVARLIGNKIGYKFTSRKVEGGFRIWRIE